MRNPKNLEEAVRGAMKIKDLRQEDLARRVHVDRTSISKYLNGHTPMPNDIKGEIVVCLRDPFVKNFAYGTPTFSVYIDNDNFDAFKSNHMGIKEMKEAIAAIEKAMNFIATIKNINDLSKEKQEEFKQTLKEVKDVEIICRTISILAGSELSVDIEEVARKSILNLIKDGLVSREQARAQGVI
ncbi:MAG: hypothetical protein BHK79_02775 [Halanaerobium sp. MDAL1]|nr:MAG: hypothetical protein BHK79_02775 [Halanaerobium sp. MDAL1]